MGGPSEASVSKAALSAWTIYGTADPCGGTGAKITGTPHPMCGTRDDESSIHSRTIAHARQCVRTHLVRRWVSPPPTGRGAGAKDRPRPPALAPLSAVPTADTDKDASRRVRRHRRRSGHAANGAASRRRMSARFSSTPVSPIELGEGRNAHLKCRERVLDGASGGEVQDARHRVVRPDARVELAEDVVSGVAEHVASESRDAVDEVDPGTDAVPGAPSASAAVLLTVVSVAPRGSLKVIVAAAGGPVTRPPRVRARAPPNTAPEGGTSGSSPWRCGAGPPGTPPRLGT